MPDPSRSPSSEPEPATGLAAAPGVMRAAAYSVHVLTALGVVCGYMALQHVADAAWERVFFWLGLAFILDGVDGPLARALNVEARTPHINGRRLDLIVDYLTYVVVPALVIGHAPLLPEMLRLPAGALVLLTSLYHFTSTPNKTDDGFFIGFPAIWNVVVFYLLIFDAGPLTATLVIGLFAALTFIPLPWLHPIRASRPRWLNLLIAGLWLAAAAWALWAHLSPGPAVKWLLALTALYVLAISLLRAIRPALFASRCTTR